MAFVDCSADGYRAKIVIAMIAYDLQCTNGHTFEGWFEDANAFEVQQSQGLIACPICSDVSVTRIPSAFAIRSSLTSAPSLPKRPNIEQLAAQVVDYVENNFDNVGANFAKEALKMHYGLSEHRNIRGVSSEAEEKMLKDEGIHFFKFPMPKQDTEKEN